MFYLLYCIGIPFLKHFFSFVFVVISFFTSKEIMNRDTAFKNAIKWFVLLISVKKKPGDLLVEWTVTKTIKINTLLDILPSMYDVCKVHEVHYVYVTSLDLQYSYFVKLKDIQGLSLTLFLYFILGGNINIKNDKHL